MADTFTPVLNLTKVGINESDDTWGQKLNANCDKIDADALATDNDITALKARCTALETEAAKASWVGEIRMHSGTLASIATIPGGVWKLCDGTNGTPNLRDKFIFGAGNVAVGATGGAASQAVTTSNHSTQPAVTGGRALSEAQMPWHGHPVNDPGHPHWLRQGGQPMIGSSLDAPGGGSGDVMARSAHGGVNTGTATADTNVTGITIDGAGCGQQHDHPLPDLSHTHTATVPTIPPWFALAFVKRVA